MEINWRGLHWTQSWIYTHMYNCCYVLLVAISAAHVYIVDVCIKLNLWFIHACISAVWHYYWSLPPPCTEYVPGSWPAVQALGQISGRDQSMAGAGNMVKWFRLLVQHKLTYRRKGWQINMLDAEWCWFVCFYNLNIYDKGMGLLPTATHRRIFKL